MNTITNRTREGRGELARGAAGQCGSRSIYIMTRSRGLALGRPTLHLAVSSVGRVTSCQQCTVSTTSSDGPQNMSKTVPAVPRLTNRMRRLARSHPEIVAKVSPLAVEDARAQYESAAKQSAKNDAGPAKTIEAQKEKSSALDSSFKGEPPEKEWWTKGQVSSPEFFAWLNTYPEGYQEEDAKSTVYDSDEELEMPDEDEYYDDYDGTEKDDSINIGKTFLIPRVKPLGYNIDIFGSDMLASRNKVLEARTGAQLRIAHERLKQTENKLRDRASGYRTTPLGWENPIPQPLPKKADGQTKIAPVREAGEPSKGGTPGETANRVVYGPSETYAYVFHRMMPAYTVLHRVMAEVQDALPDLDPRSMFDFGSGPGTATLAAWDVWGAEGGNVESSDGEERWEEGCKLSEIRLVEESQAMTDASKIMLTRLMAGGGVKVGFGSSLLEEAKAAARGQKGGKRFDLVVAAYSISHLTSHAARAAATAVLWNLVAPGGVLLVVEDGSPKGSHTVRTARQLVLDTAASAGGKEADGGNTKASGKASKAVPYVVGPCRHDKKCPLKAEQGEMCRFTQKVPWNAANVTKSAVRSALFSYVALQKRPPELNDPTSESTETKTSSSVELLKAFAKGRKAGADLATAMESLGTEGIRDENLRRQEWARLIRKPLKGRGHAFLDVCTPDGDLQRKVETRSKWKGVPGVYVAARKSQLGGLWPYLDRSNYKSTPAQNKSPQKVAEPERGEWVIEDGSDDDYDPDDDDEEEEEDGQGNRRKQKRRVITMGVNDVGFGAQSEAVYGDEDEDEDEDEDRLGSMKTATRRKNAARAEAAKYRDIRAMDDN